MNPYSYRGRYNARVAVSYAAVGGLPRGARSTCELCSSRSQGEGSSNERRPTFVWRGGLVPSPKLLQTQLNR